MMGYDIYVYILHVYIYILYIYILYSGLKKMIKLVFVGIREVLTCGNILWMHGGSVSALA
jgi:hypothetical protein